MTYLCVAILSWQFFSLVMYNIKDWWHAKIFIKFTNYQTLTEWCDFSKFMFCNREQHSTLHHVTYISCNFCSVECCCWCKQFLLQIPHVHTTKKDMSPQWSLLTIHGDGFVRSTCLVVWDCLNNIYVSAVLIFGQESVLLEWLRQPYCVLGQCGERPVFNTMASSAAKGMSRCVCDWIIISKIKFMQSWQHKTALYTRPKPGL